MTFRLLAVTTTRAMPASSKRKKSKPPRVAAGGTAAVQKLTRLQKQRRGATASAAAAKRSCRGGGGGVGGRTARSGRRKVGSGCGGGSGGSGGGGQATETIDRRRNRWESRFESLRNFVETHGHARVPGTYAKDRPLGQWVSTQRAAYRAERVRLAGGSPKFNGRISADQVVRLEGIGFEWEIHDLWAERWEERFRSLLRFVEQHGHARVPKGKGKDRPLGEWVSKQRKAYRAERVRLAGGSPTCTYRISADQVARLEGIGFEWEIHDLWAHRWEERFQSLLRFVEQHGHARVPKGYAKDRPLGKWVSRQRAAYHAERVRLAGGSPKCNGRISADQVARLEGIGFEWAARRRRAC